MPKETEAIAIPQTPELAGFKFPARLAWVCLLLAAAFATVLPGLAGSWFDERADMQHGALVPACVAAMVWHKSKSLSRVPVEVQPRGLLLVLLAFFLAAAGSLGQWTSVSRGAVVLSIAGVVWYWRGWSMLRALAYPLGVLIFMITPPTSLYEELTFRLQLVASGLAERILDLIGITVLREGNILELSGGLRLSVVEACSGIRSLVTVLFFFIVYNYFLVERRAFRWILVGCAVPATILGNALRIVLTAYFSRTRPELASGVYHSLAGYVIILMAAGAGILIHLLLERFFALTPLRRAEGEPA